MAKTEIEDVILAFDHLIRRESESRFQDKSAENWKEERKENRYRIRGISVAETQTIELFLYMLDNFSLQYD